MKAVRVTGSIVKAGDRPDVYPDAISRRIARNHRVIVGQYFVGVFHRNATTELEALTSRRTNQSRADIQQYTVNLQGCHIGIPRLTSSL